MIAREGLPLILAGLAMTVIVLLGALRLNSWWLFGVTAVLVLLTLFTTFFFRDPRRGISGTPGLLLAPADGRILRIDTVDSYPHVGGRAVKISIFLSILDVHINRIPATGVIDYVKHNPGKFFAAFEDKASDLNEQTEIGLTAESGDKIVFKQIAGLIARRIVCRLRPGDSVTAGERFGMIRFGSRAELFVPAESEVSVNPGDHVYAGLTAVGYLPGRGSARLSEQSTRGENVEL